MVMRHTWVRIAYRVRVVHFEQDVELRLEVPNGDRARVLQDLDSDYGPMPAGLVHHTELALA